MRPLLVLLLAGGAGAQSCGFDRLGTLPHITAACCESTKKSDCSAGFPKTCTLTCAKQLVPFHNACLKVLSSMPKENYAFDMQDMDSYVQNCKHTQELFQYSTTTGCAANDADKQRRVLDVTTACCTQHGNFTCHEGMPWTCNAECATTYVPFFDDCLRRDRAISVTQLTKYKRLYEACANLPPKEVGQLLANLNNLVENPKCHVNTSGIVARGPAFKLATNAAGKACKDDDKKLGKMYPGLTCLNAAASKAGCGYPKVSDVCSCSCQVHASKGQVSCVDNDAGLQKLGYSGVTCLAAAASGVGCKMAGVGNLCQCSCGGVKHRRLQASIFPSTPANLVTNTGCVWDKFDDQLVHVSAVCCPRGCKNTVPSSCSFDCGRVFANMMLKCGPLIKILLVDGNANAMSPYTAFLDRCQKLDPRSLAIAAYKARCAECGNGHVESWASEQCDAGSKNTDKPAYETGRACRSDCKLARCGDGITDDDEDCDTGAFKVGDNVVVATKTTASGWSPAKVMKIDRGLYTVEFSSGSKMMASRTQLGKEYSAIGANDGSGRSNICSECTRV